MFVINDNNNNLVHEKNDNIHQNKVIKCLGKYDYSIKKLIKM